MVKRKDQPYRLGFAYTEYSMNIMMHSRRYTNVDIRYRIRDRASCAPHNGYKMNVLTNFTPQFFTTKSLKGSGFGRPGSSSGKITRSNSAVRSHSWIKDFMAKRSRWEQSKEVKVTYQSFLLAFQWLHFQGL